MNQEWIDFKLLMAARIGDTKQIREALDLGADMRATNDKGFGPVALCCHKNNLEGLQTLLRAGANAKGLDPTGRDALMHTACLGWTDGVELLLPLCDPQRADMSGFTALMLAATHNTPSTVEALISASDPHAQDHLGRNALMHAARTGAHECAPLLMPHSNPLLRCAKGFTAADHSAARASGPTRPGLTEMLRSFEIAAELRASLPKGRVAPDGPRL